jgi:hypothetical protein
MNVVIDGGPAGVHPDDIVVERSELLHLLSQGVIEPQGHERDVLISYQAFIRGLIMKETRYGVGL